MTSERDLDWRRLLGPGAIVAAVLLWFGPLLGGGETLALRDTLLDFLPWREYAAQALSDGALPLWSHESRMGQPFLAHPQSAVFYPPHLLWLFLPSVIALVLTQAGHLLLLGLGAYALARRLELLAAPAVLAAAGVMFSTYTAAQMEFLPAFETVCWAPLTLLLADRVRSAVTAAERSFAGSARPVALLGVVWTVQALAGHPQALFQNITIVALFSVARAGSGRALLRTFGALTVAGLLGVALAAPQIFTSLAHLGESTRSGAVSSGAAEASVHPRYLWALVAPYAFGRPGYDGTWWNTDVYEFWAAICHVGIVPLVLAPLAVLRRGRLRLAGAFGGIALVGLVLAMGEHTPVYPFLADHVPPFDRFRWPGKWLHLVAFSLPFLGALGLQALLDKGAERAVRAALAVGGVLLVFVGAAYAAGDASFYSALLGATFDDDLLLAAVGAEHVRALLTVAAVVGVVALLLRPRWRPVAAAVLATLALVDAGTQSRSLHGTVPSDVTTYVPEWVEGARAGEPMRVHTTHSLGQLWLYGQSGAPWYVWARDASMGESLLPLGVDRTWGFGQLIPRRQWGAWKRLQEPSLPSFERERLSDLLNIGLVIHGAAFDQAAVRSGRLPALRLLPRTSQLPRAFVVGDARSAGDDPWAQLLDPGFDPRTTVLLHDIGDASDAELERGEGRRLTASPVRYSWNRIEVQLEGGSPGRLVLLEPYDSRWSCMTELGEPVPIHRANGLFMAARTGADGDSLVFHYREPALLAGAAVAGLALLGVLLLVLRGRDT